MIDRRHLLMGGLCLVAGGVAYAAKPRKHLSLVGEAQLEDLLPRSFGSWVSRDVSDPLALNNPESLAAKLYSQIITRVYSNLETGRSVVMLVAYGAEQTDDLQLHRPEVCYPAFGYDIVRNEAIQMPLIGGVALPARRLSASVEQRHESIIYWSRIGETLPLDGGEQRRDRLRLAMQGVVPDGLLARFTAPAAEPGGAWPELTGFVPALLAAVAPANRKVLIGTERAERLRAALPAALA